MEKKSWLAKTVGHAKAISSLSPKVRMQVDPRLTKDGQIDLHRDARLGRTTTGTGLVAQHTLAELQRLQFKDSAGHVTNNSIPTLDEAIRWARGKAILMLDQKDGM